MILGLDQSPRITAYCYGEPQGKPTFGSHHHPDYGDNTQALKRECRQWLTQFAKSIGATSIYWEQIIIYPQRLETNDLHKQFGLAAVIEIVADELGIEAYETLLTDWRKLFLGRPGAPGFVKDKTAWLKAAAERACLERGWPVKNHHEAEAGGIWNYGCACENKLYRLNAEAAMRRAEHVADRQRAGGFV